MGNLALPIEEIRANLKRELSVQRRFVLEAPTGSGKSTQTPQMLIDEGLAGSGQVVVLQPRRVAARMLARRVAGERGQQPGQEVGYQVRFERAMSAATRILYVTEGVLLRRMLDEPALPGVGAILFDEFHERHLYGDVTLAKALQLQVERRPDLLLGVMSATLDVGPLEQFLSPCAMLRSEGRTFPVEIRYAGNPPQQGRGETPVWDYAAQECSRLMRQEEGDVLIFMPGAYEIRRTIAALESAPGVRGSLITPLFGELTPEQQDLALNPANRRKIVVATNLAETSLTIDGVRCVIDSGLARIPSFDPNRGINTLLVRKISQASADQRAGRAGRTAPGVCVRLWSQRDHENRLRQEAPEIHRLDLSEIMLFLKAAGVEDLAAFPWFEAPAQAALDRALTILRDLGAIDRDGALTDTGLQMSAFPLHPRYARMMIEGDRMGCLQSVILVAALSQGRSIVLPMDNARERDERELLFEARIPQLAESDFFQDLAAFTLAAENKFDFAWCKQWGVHAQAARQAAQLFNQLAAVARGQGLDVGDSRASSGSIRRAILAGFSDHLAKRLDRGTLRCALVHGRRGELRRESLVTAPLLVSAEIEERNLRGDVNVLLGMNTAIEEGWLRELFPEDFEERQEVTFDSQQRRVVARILRRFRDLVLDEIPAGEPSLDAAARLLAEEVNAGRLILKQWDVEVERWIARCNFVAHHFPEYEIAPIGDEERQLLVEQICHGAIGYKEIKDRPVMPILRQWLTPEQAPMLDLCAPERIDLPSGARARVRYEPDCSAVLSATVQQLYDAPARVLIADRVPVTFEILAPNRRPVQITKDLGAFWTGSYLEIRKQLKGRYPRHEWR